MNLPELCLLSTLWCGIVFTCSRYHVEQADGWKDTKIHIIYIISMRVSLDGEQKLIGDGVVKDDGRRGNRANCCHFPVAFIIIIII